MERSSDIEAGVRPEDKIVSVKQPLKVRTGLRYVAKKRFCL